jgi:hypothetical protein
MPIEQVGSTVSLPRKGLDSYKLVVARTEMNDRCVELSQQYVNPELVRYTYEEDHTLDGGAHHDDTVRVTVRHWYRHRGVKDEAKADEGATG